MTLHTFTTPSRMSSRLLMLSSKRQVAKDSESGRRVTRVNSGGHKSHTLCRALQTMKE